MIDNCKICSDGDSDTRMVCLHLIAHAVDALSANKLYTRQVP